MWDKLCMFLKCKTKLEKRLGQSPSCDHLNRALRYLLKFPTNDKHAIEEICLAIYDADGYFDEDILQLLKENHIYW